MPSDERGLAETLPYTRYATLPAHARIVDRLADLLFAADDMLQTLHGADTRRFPWVEPRIQGVYDTVNDVMKKLCD